jgi:hypothetical protein
MPAPPNSNNLREFPKGTGCPFKGAPPTDLRAFKKTPRISIGTGCFSKKARILNTRNDRKIDVQIETTAPDASCNRHFVAWIWSARINTCGLKSTRRKVRRSPKGGIDG